MRNENSPAMIGWGASLPAQVRKNSDPIFDWIRHHQPPGTNLFEGFKDRRALKEGEKIVDHVIESSRIAIQKAGIEARDIDLIMGSVLKSEYTIPDEITKVHLELKLRPDCFVLPIPNTANNFNSSLLLADSLIKQGIAKNILIALGTNMTRHVDYRTPQCVSMSDAAGAAVIGYPVRKKESYFHLVAHDSYTQSGNYGALFIKPYSTEIGVHFKGQPNDLFTKSVLQLDVGKVTKMFKEFGHKYPPMVSKKVIEACGIKSSDVTFIAHQPTPGQLDAWIKAIKPGQVLQSMETYANMVPATVPVNIATFYDKIEKDYLLLLSTGPEVQTMATLLKRSS